MDDNNNNLPSPGKAEGPLEEGGNRNKGGDLVENEEKQNQIDQYYIEHFGDTRRGDATAVPFIYSPKYNIQALGLEKLHPFDSCKYGRIVGFLQNMGINQEQSEKEGPKEKKGKHIKFISTKQIIEPTKQTPMEILSLVHTKEYLDTLKDSGAVAQITEVFIISYIPNFFVKLSGSIMAGKVALERGWSINLSGGYHHACAYQGGGFCVYSDITLSIRILRQNYPSIERIMIIDLDAHQGNGHERDKIHFQDENLYIFDMFNKDIYPGDWEARKAINREVKLKSGIKDDEYIEKLTEGLASAFHEFLPQVIYYNAGTDILEGDNLGCMNISKQGVIQRDQIVFETARKKGIPIVTLLSGGYQRTNAEVIAASIVNLHEKGLIPRE